MHSLIPRLFIIRKSQMAFDFSAEPHHVAYTRTNNRGTVSQIQAKGAQPSQKYPRPLYHLPTKQEIADLKVGDMAPDSFGRMSKVVEITHKGTDIEGKDFVTYYTAHGSNGRMSNSLKEDRLNSSVALSNKHTSSEIALINREMLAERGNSAPSAPSPVSKPTHPVFTNYDEALAYVERKRRSVRGYTSSEEYRNLYPHIKELQRQAKQKQAQAIEEYRRAGKYPDGRLVPKEGDKVFMSARGMFGMGASIKGEVYRTREGKLRVKKTGTSSMFGEQATGDSFELTPEWSVQNDPEFNRREEARKQQEQAAEHKRLNEQREWQNKQRMEYMDALARGEKPVKATDAKVGDVLNYYDGFSEPKKIEVRQVEEWNGGVYVTVSDPGHLVKDGDEEHYPGDFSTTLNLPDFDGGEMPRVTRPAPAAPAPAWEQKGKVMSYRMDFPNSIKKNHHIIASYQPKPGGWDYHYQLEERYTKDGNQKKIVHLTGKHSFESETKNILMKEIGKKKQEIQTRKKQPNWMHNADTRRG